MHVNTLINHVNFNYTRPGFSTGHYSDAGRDAIVFSRDAIDLAATLWFLPAMLSCLPAKCSQWHWLVNFRTIYSSWQKQVIDTYTVIVASFVFSVSGQYFRKLYEWQRLQKHFNTSDPRPLLTTMTQFTRSFMENYMIGSCDERTNNLREHQTWLN